MKASTVRMVMIVAGLALVIGFFSAAFFTSSFICTRQGSPRLHWLMPMTHGSCAVPACLPEAGPPPSPPFLQAIAPPPIEIEIEASEAMRARAWSKVLRRIGGECKSVGSNSLNESTGLAVRGTIA